LQEQNIRDTVGLEATEQSAAGSEAGGDSHTAEPVKYGYAQIREAITERLGGPFDYLGFQ
jgi:hypothetical protein